MTGASLVTSKGVPNMLEFLDWDGVTVFIAIAVTVNIAFWGVVMLLWRASRVSRGCEVYGHDYVQWLIVLAGSTVCVMYAAQYAFQQFTGAAV